MPQLWAITCQINEFIILMKKFYNCDFQGYNFDTRPILKPFVIAYCWLQTQEVHLLRSFRILLSELYSLLKHLPQHNALHQSPKHVRIFPNRNIRMINVTNYWGINPSQPLLCLVCMRPTYKKQLYKSYKWEWRMHSLFTWGHTSSFRLILRIKIIWWSQKNIIFCNVLKFILQL